MSDTPMAADDCKKLLDNGYLIVMFRNLMGSYTARAVPDPTAQRIVKMTCELPEHLETDDFEPSQALYWLTEKATTGRIA